MCKITDDIYYIGVNDLSIDLFENQYIVPEGITYNSYIIMDEKIMIVATTGEEFRETWMENVRKTLNGRNPDYLLIQHMEPDHSSAIADIMDAYPDTVIAASKGAFNMMKNYFGTGYEGHDLVIKDGDIISLGKHELLFTAAPMVHWPEVMFAYDRKDHVLFSADAFGRFGAPHGSAKNAADGEFEAEEWFDEARRYYIGIVGKHGDPVQKALAKAKDLEISKICPLHGPMLTHDLEKYLDVYDKWSSYAPEKKGIAICYSSVYGHTREAVSVLEKMLKEQYKGFTHCCSENDEDLRIKIFDLARDDMSTAVAACFEFDRVVLATTTYYNEIFPCMQDFINHLKHSAFQKRKVGLIENGSWAPKAAGVMKKMLEECPGIEYCDTTVTLKSALNEDSKAQLAELASELLNS